MTAGLPTRDGHLTPESYARAARLLADLKHVPFPSLVGAIRELWEAADNVRAIVTARKPKPEGA